MRETIENRWDGRESDKAEEQVSQKEDKKIQNETISNGCVGDVTRNMRCTAMCILFSQSAISPPQRNNDNLLSRSLFVTVMFGIGFIAATVLLYVIWNANIPNFMGC